MDKKRLRNYEYLRDSITDLRKRIDKLYDRKAEIPTVLGKVVGSSHDFPYTEIRTTVQMEEPVEAEKINQQIRELEKEIADNINEMDEIEKFIYGIHDPRIRLIFSKTFLDGQKQTDVGVIAGYSKGRISQIISDYLKV